MGKILHRTWEFVSARTHKLHWITGTLAESRVLAVFVVGFCWRKTIAIHFALASARFTMESVGEMRHGTLSWFRPSIGGAQSGQSVQRTQCNCPRFTELPFSLLKIFTSRLRARKNVVIICSFHALIVHFAPKLLLGNVTAKWLLGNNVVATVHNRSGLNSGSPLMFQTQCSTTDPSPLIARRACSQQAQCTTQKLS